MGTNHDDQAEHISRSVGRFDAIDGPIRIPIKPQTTTTTTTIAWNEERACRCQSQSSVRRRNDDITRVHVMNVAETSYLGDGRWAPRVGSGFFLVTVLLPLLFEHYHRNKMEVHICKQYVSFSILYSVYMIDIFTVGISRF